MDDSYTLCFLRRSSEPGPDAILETLYRIPSEDVASFKESNRELQHHQNLNLLGFVTAQVESYREVTSELLALSVLKGIAAPPAEVATLSLRARSAIVGFTASVHMYQEHAEARSDRVGGEELKSELHALFGRYYRAHPDLFLMRKLRDHVVHSDLGFMAMRFGSRVDEDSRVFHFGSVVLKVGELSKVKRFNQALRAHILERNQGQDIEAIDVMQPAASALERIDADVTRLCYADQALHARTVADFAQRHLARAGIPVECLILVRTTSDGKPILGEPSMELFRSEDLEHARRLAE